MVSSNEDILVEIPDDQLPKLKAFYQEKAPWAPHMVNFVETGIRWKQVEKYKDGIIFYSPNNCWEEDGTVIILITLYTHDFYVFTLDENCTNLEKGLSETNLLQYQNKRTVFYAIDDKIFPTIKKHIEARKLRVTDQFPCFLYGVPPEDAKKFTIECPSDVYIKRIGAESAKQIDDLWPHNFPGSDKYIGSFLDFYSGYGIFLKSTNQMVTWLIRHAFGNMTMMQTEEQHKRKGYANLVTKTLAKEIAEEGYWALATAITTNKSANSLFRNLGFKVVANCTFVVTE